jgi:carbonic anhydrase/acetyltransferase-like protein (isoleucine patch superfamily)
MECKTSSVNGVVSKADDVIIHPKATVRAADNASITIGDGCIIEELCVIEAAEGCHMEIGKGNLFQVQLP